MVTATELKTALKVYNLSTSGNKAQLQARLDEFDASDHKQAPAEVSTEKFADIASFMRPVSRGAALPASQGTDDVASSDDDELEAELANVMDTGTPSQHSPRIDSGDTQLPHIELVDTTQSCDTTIGATTKADSPRLPSVDPQPCDTTTGVTDDTDMPRAPSVDSHATDYTLEMPPFGPNTTRYDDPLLDLLFTGDPMSDSRVIAPLVLDDLEVHHDDAASICHTDEEADIADSVGAIPDATKDMLCAQYARASCIRGPYYTRLATI
jgi:hypothetical protein